MAWRGESESDWLGKLKGRERAVELRLDIVKTAWDRF